MSNTPTQNKERLLIRTLASFLNNMQTKKQEESIFELKGGALMQ